jgi:DNA-binding NarL/FixJ family response regulator
MKPEVINVSILDDHQGIIDGYLYRLKDEPSLKISGIANFGEELDPMLARHITDVLILDIGVPVSRTNPTSFLIMQVIPRLKRTFPRMKFLVISMHAEIVLIEKLVELGINGYIVKSDYDSIMRLASIIVKIKKGGTYYSPYVEEKLNVLKKTRSQTSLLSARQLEALSLCVVYPDDSSDDLAKRLGVSSAAFRNLISKAYERIGVRTRSAAIAYLQKSGLNDST